MRIVYHLGAHCTDEERLLKCLLKNRGPLAAEGIVVPGPARYRNLLRDTAVMLKGQPATQDTQALVLDQIMDEDVAERLILSWDSFLAFPQGVLRRKLYPVAAERLRSFTQIFPEIEPEFHLAIRNPATFVPTLFARQRGKSYAEFTEGTDLLQLRWSDLIADIRRANPSVPLTVWCDEDTPLIWPEVLRAVAGHSAGLRLEEDDDLLATIMSPEGFRRMTAYLDGHPPGDEIQRRRIVSAFLDKFALPEQIEMELEMPGWTEDLVATLTLQYDRDVALIASRPDVTFLAP